MLPCRCALAGALSACPTLTTLQLGSNNGVDDSVVEALAAAPGGLTNLDLSATQVGGCRRLLVHHDHGTGLVHACMHAHEHG